MNFVTVKLAGIPIAVYSESKYISDFYLDYLSDESPLFSVSATEEAVISEMENASEPTTYEYAEALCMYREMAEKLPLFDCAVFHGAAIEYCGKAYLFTAPSGTGKTTHISLWRRFLGRGVGIINGDKPIVRNTSDGITVWGTPYAGKEGWQRNVSFPLAGICFLSQGKDNKMTRLVNGSFLKLFTQIYKPRNREAMQKTVSLVKAFCEIPCFELSCDMSEDAVKASFEALTDMRYEEKKNENM